MQRVLRTLVVVIVSLAVMLPDPAGADTVAAGTGTATVDPGFGQDSDVLVHLGLAGVFDKLPGTRSCDMWAREQPVQSGNPTIGIAVAYMTCRGTSTFQCVFNWSRVGTAVVLSGASALLFGCRFGQDPTLHDATGTLVLYSLDPLSPTTYAVVGTLGIVNKIEVA